MSFTSMLNNSMIVFRKSEGAENDYGNPELIYSTLYGAPNDTPYGNQAVLDNTTVPCAIQEYEQMFYDEQKPAAIANELMTVYCPVITIAQDNVLFIDSEYYTVERKGNGGGRDHHLELIVRRQKVL